MSETADYSPGVWKGHDFTDARKKYDAHVGRSYGDAVVTGKKAADCVPDRIKTKSKSPLAILCDVTGSMGKWPAAIFSKLPYLEIEGKQYLGDDLEISFCAFGDVYCDKYPLQVRKFSKETDLKIQLEALVIEGGGGGQVKESPEMAALYYARNVDMPVASKPICIIITDESLYETINKEDAKAHAKVDLESRIKTKDVFDELKRRYAVYLVRKPYNAASGDAVSSTDKGIVKEWLKVLDEEHIVTLPNEERVLDIIFGILAKETDRIDYFRDELKDRQLKDKGGAKKVEVALKALETVHKIDAGDADPDCKLLKSGRSVTKGSGGGKKTKSLL
jgi:hypothetical protein